MGILIKTGRLFFAVGMIAFCLHQLIYADLRPVILATWPSWIPVPFVFAYVVNVLIITACIMIILERRARLMAVFLGWFIILAVLINHIPYQLANNLHFIAAWGDALKALALCGGAFAVAGSLPQEKLIHQSKFNSWNNFLEKLIPYARIFFSITIIIFGLEHFIYPAFVAMLIPAWIPWHFFWTYFAGIALIVSGFAIVFKVKAALAATMLGGMIFMWFILLHLPRGIADPYTGNGNELRSVFESLIFSGIAFMVAGLSKITS